MTLLNGIREPADLRALSVEDAYRLAGEIRRLIIETVSVNGGHLSSNLGVVELTIALHRVFATPKDSIVWDVGHQCYAHKLLTGRREAFAGLRKAGGLSGFPKRAESPHDAFDAGHASTSLSAALGLLIAKTSRGEDSSVVAVIGDGALTGGMVYEAMSHAGQLGLPLIVVLNDNSMSISPNVGAMSRYLSRLTTTVPYQNFRRMADKAMLAIPFAGKAIYRSVMRAKKSVKAFFFKESLFADFGFEYAGPIDGHNISLLEDVLRQSRAIRKPVVVHVTTKKGKGHAAAEDDPSTWHGVSPSGTATAAASCGDPDRPSFTQVFGSHAVELALRDSRVAAVTAAMAKGTGLAEFQRRFPGRFFDVGIAEEHAVTMAAGMAAEGMRPIVAIYSTFMQRAVDQVHHDVALNSLPVLFALDRSGAVPDDGETHQGIYDIQIFRAVPGLAILAPASAAELRAAMDWALSRPEGPVMIRFPKDACPRERRGYDMPLDEVPAVFLHRSSLPGPAALLVASGPLSDAAAQAAEELEGRGIRCDALHLRFLKPLEINYLSDLFARYDAVVAAEEGVLTGSVAAELAALAAAGGRRSRALGFAERPLSQASRPELLAQAGLDFASLAQAVTQELAGFAEELPRGVAPEVTA